MNNLEQETEKTEPKIPFKQKLITNVNWITISFVVLLYVILGIMEFDDGAIRIKDMSGWIWLDWVVWAVLTFVPAFLSLVVITTLKFEGLKQAKVTLKPYIDKYQSLLFIDVNRKIRSEKEFIAEGAIKDSLFKFTQALILSIVSGQMLYSWTVDSLLKIVINLSMWAYFGFTAFNKAHEYGITELKEWYIIETAKLHQKMVESKRFIESGEQNDKKITNVYN